MTLNLVAPVIHTRSVSLMKIPVVMEIIGNIVGVKILGAPIGVKTIVDSFPMTGRRPVTVNLAEPAYIIFCWALRSMMYWTCAKIAFGFKTQLLIKISVLIMAEILSKIALTSMVIPPIGVLMLAIAKIAVFKTIVIESLISIEIVGFSGKLIATVNVITSIGTIIGVATIIGIIIVHSVIPAFIIGTITVLVILGLALIDQQFYHCIQF